MTTEMRTPEVGQAVRVRNRLATVRAVEPYDSRDAGRLHLVEVEYLDDCHFPAADQLLWEVELPLATRTILAGLRIATVTTIGTATIAAAIGGGGLGVFIFRGLASVDTTLLLAGAVPAALIAVAADRGIEWVEHKLSPV